MAPAISTLETLIDSLSSAPESELRFTVEDTDVRPGYHVTEIKLAHVRGLDCGQHMDAWDETLVQLLDGPDKPGQYSEFMTTAKFLKIAQAGSAAAHGVDGAQLYFEFSTGRDALRKLSVQNVSFAGEQTRIALGSVTALCKPANRKAQSGCC